ncbi:Protein C2-DOMAIN ABA-RELATED 4 [Linum perenne]
MENMMGLLRIKVVRGVNLAVRDVRSSDPYAIVRMGKQNVNPEWNETLTLSVTDPNLPVKIEVYDWDLFSRDDLLGNAEFEIGSFVEAVRMKLKALPSGTIITKVHPSRTNDLSEESNVVWVNDEVVQTLFLRLRNVECGEVELELRWIDIPGSKGV